MYNSVYYWGHTQLRPFSKSKFNLKSDRVNLVAPGSLSVCFIYPYPYPGDTVQTGTGKVDSAWKFKCARGHLKLRDSPCNIDISYYDLGLSLIFFNKRSNSKFNPIIHIFTNID